MSKVLFPQGAGVLVSEDTQGTPISSYGAIGVVGIKCGLETDLQLQAWPTGGSVNSGIGAGIRIHVTGASESLYADAGDFSRKEI